MILDRFLSRRGDRAPRRRKPNHVSPRVELLEDRLAPATFTVTTPADVLGSSSGQPNYSLRQAILDSDNTAGPNTINVPAGTYTLSRGGSLHDGTENALFIAHQAVTINGQGTVIVNANSLDRVFTVDSGVTVTFNGIAITGGDATSNSFGGAVGGAIWTPFSANINLNNVFIYNNHADGNGGGICMSNGNLTVSGGAINGNSATGNGGGVYFNVTSGTVQIGTPNTQTGGSDIGTSVSNNRATNGGGMDVVCNTLNMSYCNVIGNTATSAGGGLFATISFVYDIAFCNFSHNNGGGSGGGMYLVDTGGGSTAGSMTNSVVADNVASSSGSGLRWTLSGTNTVAGMSGCDVSGNSGPNGTAGGSGASFHVNSGGLTVDFSTFDHNIATGTGGGIYVASGGTTAFYDDTITNNSVTGGFGGGFGGTVSGGTMSLDSLTIRDNTAKSGGGIYISGAASVYSSIIAKNTATNSQQDVYGSTISDHGYNLVGITNGRFTASTSRFGNAGSPLDPGTGPLESNGPVFYFNLANATLGYTANVLSTSSAIAAGNPADAGSFDQRQVFQRQSTPTTGAFEYEGLGGVSHNIAFVENMYETLIGRTADSSGLNYWVSYLNNGGSRSGLILNFL